MGNKIKSLSQQYASLGNTRTKRLCLTREPREEACYDASSYKVSKNKQCYQWYCFPHEIEVPHDRRAKIFFHCRAYQNTSNIYPSGVCTDLVVERQCDDQEHSSYVLFDFDYQHEKPICHEEIDDISLHTQASFHDDLDNISSSFREALHGTSHDMPYGRKNVLPDVLDNEPFHELKSLHDEFQDKPFYEIRFLHVAFDGILCHICPAPRGALGNKPYDMPYTSQDTFDNASYNRPHAFRDEHNDMPYALLYVLGYTYWLSLLVLRGVLRGTPSHGLKSLRDALHDIPFHKPYALLDVIRDTTYSLHLSLHGVLDSIGYHLAFCILCIFPSDRLWSSYICEKNQELQGEYDHMGQYIALRGGLDVKYSYVKKLTFLASRLGISQVSPGHHHVQMQIIKDLSLFTTINIAHSNILINYTRNSTYCRNNSMLVYKKDKIDWATFGDGLRGLSADKPGRK